MKKNMYVILFTKILSSSVFFIWMLITQKAFNIKYIIIYTVYQENWYFVKNMILLKNPQFYPNHYEILWKWGTHEYSFYVSNTDFLHTMCVRRIDTWSKICFYWKIHNFYPIITQFCENCGFLNKSIFLKKYRFSWHTLYTKHLY